MLDADITARLVAKATLLGFDLCGVAPAESCSQPDHLAEWLARGYAGEMRYLHDSRRESLDDVLPGARSVIVCAINYNTDLPRSIFASAPPSSSVGEKSLRASPRAWISRYAWGHDYHDVLKPRLDALVSWLREELRQDFNSRIYVDTGPVLERLAAKHAGLGWLAKNTCLINQQLGSWFFLGVILTDLDLSPTLSEPRTPPPDLCGTCTRCLDACPTHAFAAPYVLDARRCISYLTIELRSAIPEEFRPAMGSMVFGCDICQDVCPWNRKAPVTAHPEFLPRNIAAQEGDSASLFMPELEWLISLSEEEFRRVFRGSPIKRAKWRGLLRNACVALGNSNLDPEDPASTRIMQRLNELAAAEDSMLAEHAAWALARLRAMAKSQNAGTTPNHLPAKKASVSLTEPLQKFTNHAEEK